MKPESWEAKRNRRSAEVLLCLELALKDARTPDDYTNRYYEPLKRRRIVRLAKKYGRNDGLSAPEIETVLEMSVADAMGIKT